jgi:branched-chain amino acid transport system substrate-binding protein
MSDNGKRSSGRLDRNRRRYLKYASTAVAAGLAGCSGADKGGADGADGGGGDGGESSVATTTSGGNNPDEFVIGSNHPMSGSLSYTGVSMYRALELAAKQKNAAGGIKSLGGAKVRILEGDNEASQERAGQVSQQLMEKGADVVTGCFNSDATLSATAATEREGVPFVVTVAASDRILKERDVNYTYRIQPTTFHYARDWAKFYSTLIRDNGHEINTVGHYYIDNAYGAEINDYLSNQFLAKNNMELVEETAVTLNANSASSQVTKLQQADPDCICITGYQQDAILFFDALKNLDYRPRWLSASASVALVSADQIEAIGEPANGIMDANYALNPTNDLTTKFTKNYEQFADRAATPEAGMTWAVAQVIFDAVERAGTTDRDALNKAIASTEMGPEEVPVALDGIRFQDNGENALALAAMNQVQDGNIKVVYPEEFAAAQPIVKPGET